MSALSVLNDARAMALMVGRRMIVLRRSRGLWGTAVYCAQSLCELPHRVTLLFDEAAYDRKTGLETSRLVNVADLGIDAAKMDGASRNASGIAYMPTPAGVIAPILKDLGLRYNEYSFIDFGSGMGRVVFVAAQFPFRKVVGVEFSDELHRIAERNLAKLSGTLNAAAVELICQDAQGYIFPAGNFVVYLFNPFRDTVMQTVLKNLERRFARSPAELYLIYYNPVLGNMLDAAPFLKRIKTTREYSIYRNLVEKLPLDMQCSGQTSKTASNGVTNCEQNQRASNK
jgi:SAM-dependent methyltransferase